MTSRQRSASIVVVGGGIIGVSIAYHLARRGLGHETVVVDRGTLGSGSTSKSVGGIRCQFSSAINVRMSQAALPFWEGFESTFGAPLDFVRSGYLILARTRETLDRLARAVDMQNDLGVGSRMVEVADVVDLVPAINPAGIVGASYHDRDGYAGPHEALSALSRAAKRLGVTFLEGQAVQGFERVGRRIVEVNTVAGTIKAETTVIAAGPWAAEVAALAGISVPVVPVRRDVFVSAPTAGIDRRWPLVMDVDNNWYFRVEGDAVLMSGRQGEPGDDRLSVDWSALGDVAETAVRCVPMFSDLAFGNRAWAGLYEQTPDGHAILGPVPGLDDVILACGFSGHGFQHSPTVGRLIADLVADGRSHDPDLHRLGLDRFADRDRRLPLEALAAHRTSTGP